MTFFHNFIFSMLWEKCSQYYRLSICCHFGWVWQGIAKLVSESETNPNNNLMMRRAGLSIHPPLLPLDLKAQLGRQLLAVDRLVWQQTPDFAWKCNYKYRYKFNYKYRYKHKHKYEYKYKLKRGLFCCQFADDNENGKAHPIFGRRAQWRYTRGEGQRQREKSEEVNWRNYEMWKERKIMINMEEECVICQLVNWCQVQFSQIIQIRFFSDIGSKLLIIITIIKKAFDDNVIISI